MKKIASILVLVFAFTITTQAQKREKAPKLSTDQQVNLAVKKMTLALDLSEQQQNQIKPIITNQITERKAAMELRKKAKESGEKPTSDEIYAAKMKQLDSRIATKNKMKNILNKKQFEKFEKMKKNKGKKGKGKKGAKKGKRKNKE